MQAQSVVVKNWKQYKYLSVKKLWYIPSLEHNTAAKKDGVSLLYIQWHGKDHIDK